MRNAIVLLLALSSLLLCACQFEDGGPCDVVSFPTANGAAIHVSASCGSAAGDGSRARPFDSPALAAKSATSGSVILVAAGTYAGGIVLPAGASLIGAGRDVVVIKPLGTRGISVVGAGTSEIRALSVVGATGAAIDTTGASLGVQGCALSGTKVASDGAGGHGISVSSSPSLVVDGTDVSANDGWGIVAFGVAKVTLGGAGGGSPRPDNDVDPKGMIDPSFMPSTSISGNKGGAVGMIDPSFGVGSGKTDSGTTAPAVLQVSGVAMRDNRTSGLALFGRVQATVDRVAVSGTVAPAGFDYADGVVVVSADSGGAPQVDLKLGRDVVLSGNGRAGLLVAAAATVQVDAQVSQNAFGGVWAQSAGSHVTVSANARLVSNQLVGVVATSGGRIDVTGARIENTVSRPFAMPAGGIPEGVGDGVGVFDGGRASIQGAILSGNARAGLLADKAKVDDVVVKDSCFSGGQYAIVLNEGTAMPAGLGTNACTPGGESAKLTTGANLGSAHSACPGQTASACTPAPSAK